MLERIQEAYTPLDCHDERFAREGSPSSLVGRCFPVCLVSSCSLACSLACYLACSLVGGCLPPSVYLVRGGGLSCFLVFFGVFFSVFFSLFFFMFFGVSFGDLFCVLVFFCLKVLCQGVCVCMSLLSSSPSGSRQV